MKLFNRLFKTAGNAIGNHDRLLHYTYPLARKIDNEADNNIQRGRNQNVQQKI